MQSMSDEELATEIVKILEAHDKEGGQVPVVLAQVQARLIGHLPENYQRKAMKYMARLVSEEARH